MAHRRFLGFARNDRKERAVGRKVRLPWDSAVVGAPGNAFLRRHHFVAEKSHRLSG